MVYMYMCFPYIISHTFIYFLHSKAKAKAYLFFFLSHPGAYVKLANKTSFFLAFLYIIFDLYEILKGLITICEFGILLNF